jgi:hypothetical protein
VNNNLDEVIALRALKLNLNCKYAQDTKLYKTLNKEI